MFNKMSMCKTVYSLEEVWSSVCTESVTEQQLSFLLFIWFYFNLVPLLDAETTFIFQEIYVRIYRHDAQSTLQIN